MRNRSGDVRGRRRSRLLGWPLVAAGLTCLAGLTGGLTGGVAMSTTADAAGPNDELVVVAQEFNVAANGTFGITVRVPPELVDALDDPDTDVIVTSFRAVTDRSVFLGVLEGKFPRTEDTLDFDPTPDTTAPSGEAAVPAVFTRPSDDTFTLRVRTESDDRTSAALQMSEPGVHPVVVELRVDGRRFEAMTFVNRLAVDDEPRGDLAVGLLLGQTSMPGVDLDGEPRSTMEERADLTDLADALTAIDTADTSAPIPRTVVVEPSSLSSLESADADLAERLTPLLAASDLVAGPRLPLDPAAAAATTPTPAFDPVGLYTRWLREGEDLLDALLPATAIDRSVYVARETLTGSGAVMLRNLGTRLIVLPYERFAAIEGSTGLFTDTTQLVSVDLGDGTSMPAAVVDPYLAERFGAGADQSLSSAIEIVADLLVVANSIDASGRLVGRHGTILATPDVGVPDAQLLGHLITLMQSTPGLQLVDPSDIATRVDTWLIDGRLVTVVPRVQGSTDLSTQVALIDTMTSDVAAYGSMLSPTDPSLDHWNGIIDAIPSTAVSDDQAVEMATALSAEFAELASGVEIEASSFTLTGRNSTGLSGVRFGVRNLTDRTLTVRIQVNSPKIRFPQGDQEVVIAPQSVTEVVTDAVALSNGTSSVFIRVYTPDGPSTETLIPQVVLTARVTSFAGVAQLITVAAVLLIIAWWARHWQRSRRTKQAAHHIRRHPASTTRRPDESDASNEPSLDAAPSTLPPS